MNSSYAYQQREARVSEQQKEIDALKIKMSGGAKTIREFSKPRMVKATLDRFKRLPVRSASRRRK